MYYIDKLKNSRQSEKTNICFGIKSVKGDKNE